MRDYNGEPICCDSCEEALLFARETRSKWHQSLGKFPWHSGVGCYRSADAHPDRDSDDS